MPNSRLESKRSAQIAYSVSAFARPSAMGPNARLRTATGVPVLLTTAIVRVPRLAITLAIAQGHE